MELQCFHSETFGQLLVSAMFTLCSLLLLFLKEFSFKTVYILLLGMFTSQNYSKILKCVQLVIDNRALGGVFIKDCIHFTKSMWFQHHYLLECALLLTCCMLWSLFVIICLSCVCVCFWDVTCDLHLRLAGLSLGVFLFDLFSSCERW